jgi:phospholipid-binding lipoprotein MlaA
LNAVNEPTRRAVAPLPIVLLLGAALAACARAPIYESNIRSAEGGCEAPHTQAGRYRCDGWVMVHRADAAHDGGTGLREAGTARVEIADALDAGRLKPSEAEAAIRAADLNAGLPVAPLKPDVNDPLEPMNRVVFRADLALDRVLIKPAAKTYRTVLPAPVRTAVRHFYDNAHGPVTFGNALLQANWSRARDTAGRFAVNSTLGIGGLFDPATGMGLPQYDEDFGQTLGTWGVGEGPYLVLPVIGPKPPRDAVGMVADHFMDPLTYVLPSGNLPLSLAIRGLDVVDKRARRIESVDAMERTSLDFYAATRSAYRQKRQAEILNKESGGTAGAGGTTISPDDFEFDDQSPAAPAQPNPPAPAPPVSSAPVS